MRHAKAIAMSMAYSLYLQCAEGSVDPDWKEVAVSGPRFQQKMSLQMVHTVKVIKLALSWGCKDAKSITDQQEEARNR